jgi:stage III sporulation protein AG
VALLIASAYLEERTAPPAAPLATAQPVLPANANYEEETENKLANLLSQVKGAGSVTVKISLENGAFLEHAKNITKETRNAEEKDSSGGTRTTVESKETAEILFSKEDGLNRPVIAREYRPVIKGVVVVAEGAADSMVKANLTKAVATSLGIPPHKIVVLAQRKRGD